MTRYVFSHFPGYLRAEFCYLESSGDIQITLHIYGGSTATRSCDEEFKLAAPVVSAAPDAVLRCWTSSSTSAFFQELIRWLEAITCNVYKCAFCWEGEGPDGELRWHRGQNNLGLLDVKWSGGRRSEAFQTDVMLEKRSLVGAMYGAFVSFIEADQYDPILYESLSDGEAYDLVVTEGRKAFAAELAARDRGSAYALIMAARRLAHYYERGPRRCEDLATLQRMAGSDLDQELPDDAVVRDEMDYLLGVSWDEWSVDQRLAHVDEVVFSFRSPGVTGERLRELRSSRIEAWLVEHSSWASHDL